MIGVFRRNAGCGFLAGIHFGERLPGVFRLGRAFEPLFQRSDRFQVFVDALPVGGTQTPAQLTSLHIEVMILRQEVGALVRGLQQMAQQAGIAPTKKGGIVLPPRR